MLLHGNNRQIILFTWNNIVKCSFELRRKWKKYDKLKNVIKIKISHRISLMTKQTLTTFRNIGTAIYDDCYVVVFK